MWLLRIATNVANGHYRKQRWRRLLLARWLTWRAGTLRSPASLTEPGAESRAARVRAAVAALPPNEQGVVVLRYYSQLGYDEIAEILGCRPEAVRTRLSRAIKRLRQRLNSER